MLIVCVCWADDHLVLFSHRTACRQSLSTNDMRNSSEVLKSQKKVYSGGQPDKIHRLAGPHLTFGGGTLTS